MRLPIGAREKRNSGREKERGSGRERGGEKEKREGERVMIKLHC